MAGFMLLSGELPLVVIGMAHAALEGRQNFVGTMTTTIIIILS
jgi:hypothetical protein